MRVNYNMYNAQLLIKDDLFIQLLILSGRCVYYRRIYLPEQNRSELFKMSVIEKGKDFKQFNLVIHLYLVKSICHGVYVTKKYGNNNEICFI